MKQTTTGPFGMGIVYDYNAIIKNDSNASVKEFKNIKEKDKKETKGYARVYSNRMQHK